MTGRDRKLESRLPGKRRTREHVIADIGFHHLALMVVECGYTIQSVASDYGYDASVITYDGDGIVENSPFWIQLKATDALDLDAERAHVRFTIAKRDIRLWADNPLPVYLVVYDAAGRRAYWLHLQRTFSARGIDPAAMNRESLRVFIDIRAIVDHDTIRAWRDDKNGQHAKIAGIGHG